MRSGLLLLGLVAMLMSCGGESGGTEGIKIAYYVKDSLATNLEIFKEGQESFAIMSEAYLSKGAAMQQEFQRVGQLYESKKSKGLLSPDAEAYYVNQLGELQQQMATLEQTEGADLQSKRNEFELDLIEQIAEYGRKYATKNNINLFLAKEQMGVVLYADSTMDVTMDFIKFMNKADK